MPVVPSHTSLVRIFAAEPPLPAVAQTTLVTALEKLVTHFVREGRCTSAAVTAQENGRFLVIAWEGPPLSGCSHDKIAQVIAAHESTSGCALLNPPPIAIGAAGNVRLTDRAGVRALLATGAAEAATVVWDVRAGHLADWNRGPQLLRESRLASLMVAGLVPIPQPVGVSA